MNSHDKKKSEAVILGTFDAIATLGAVAAVGGFIREKFESAGIRGLILVCIALLIGGAGFFGFREHLPTKKDKWKYIGVWLIVVIGFLGVAILDSLS